jgi:hypothetical protein
MMRAFLVADGGDGNRHPEAARPELGTMTSTTPAPTTTPHGALSAVEVPTMAPTTTFAICAGGGPGIPRAWPLSSPPLRDSSILQPAATTSNPLNVHGRGVHVSAAFGMPTGLGAPPSNNNIGWGMRPPSSVAPPSMPSASATHLLGSNWGMLHSSAPASPNPMWGMPPPPTVARGAEHWGNAPATDAFPYTVPVSLSNMAAPTQRTPSLDEWRIPELRTHATLHDVYNTFSTPNRHTGAPSLMDLKHRGHSSVTGHNGRKRYSEYSRFYDAVQHLYTEQKKRDATCTILKVLEDLEEKRKARSLGVSKTVKLLGVHSNALA